MVELLGLTKFRFDDGALFWDKDLMVHIARAFENVPCTVCGDDSLAMPH